MDRRHLSSRRVCPANFSYLQKSTASSGGVRLDTIRFAHLNARSINNKAASICDIVVDKELDFFCLCETWHQTNDYLNLNICAPPGYTYIDRPRSTGRGGGLAVIYRSDVVLTEVSLPCFSSFECLAFKLNGLSPVLVLNIYRPPKPNSVFFSEFTEFLTLASAICPVVLLTGDLNIHVDNVDCANTVSFIDILDCFNFTQHVNFPTHKHGHTLDLVCTSGVIIEQLDCTVVCISDHRLLTFNLIPPSLQTVKERVICFRKISDIDLDHLSLTIGDLPVVTSVDQYNTVFTCILDEIAPLKKRVVSFRRSSPWYTSELRRMKAKGRQLERIYKKSGLTVHRSMFDQHQIDYHNALKASKMAYYSTIISSDISNPRALFRAVNNLIKPPSNINCSTTEQCNEFLNYFSSKIDNIYNAIACDHASEFVELHPPNLSDHVLSSFKVVDSDFISKLVLSMNSTTCILDPFPTTVLKNCCLLFYPTLL